jgi:2-keto-4-pentenoate hydratase/2-oxohepta-3-ene-1,7-dioic acid hydratase in catechol pathway
MKIARVQTADGNVKVVTPEGSLWKECKGTLEQGWTSTGVEVEPVRFLPPVAPPVIFGIGLNYREHAREMGTPEPEYPVVFMKNPAAVIGHREEVRLPRHLRSDKVDYEVELAVVIGNTCRNVSEDRAAEVIAGYTVANDVSARDWQKEYGGGQWCKAKGFDTFCPLGPVMATPDELTDPNNLDLRMSLNGEVMQDSSTRDMIFTIPRLIAFLSASTTLLAGTVILTGTPPGVGMAQKPPRYLKAGDVMCAEVEGIGLLENRVVEEAE